MARAADPIAVLIIDDDPDIRRLLIDVLHGEEYTAVAVGTAEEGLAQLPYNDFSVAFVDHNLPGMDGLTLCGYLRRASPLIEVALVTGEDSRKLQHAAEEEGVRFLQKPLSVDEVLDVLEEHKDAVEERLRTPMANVPDYGPRLHGTLEAAATELMLPPLPERVQDSLVRRIKESLSWLRSRKRYNERDRVVVFAGIVSAKLLGVQLPRLADGRTIEEEYDRLMVRMGRRPEFGGGGSKRP